jgi:regulation of enolase protein 1 (concanavalin A-like superfamily)
MSFDRCVWHNEPAHWHLDAGHLHVTTDAQTDFWRQTHYEFTRDSGHFFGCAVQGAFTAEIRIQARYEDLYDQAGLMVRVDEAKWVKAGIELSDGHPMLSSVLTLGRSDWATGRYGGNPADFWMRATVKDGALRLQVSADGQHWPLVRLAPFPPAATLFVGPMCCTPERAGLQVDFSAFRVGPPLDKALHDLS